MNYFTCQVYRPIISFLVIIFQGDVGDQGVDGNDGPAGRPVLL